VKITKRQLRRIIKEEVDSRLKNTHHDPRYQEGPPGGQEAYVASKETEAAERERERKHDQKTLEFINPTQKHIQKYLDQAQKLNLEVVENTPRLLLVQGLEDDLVEFDAYFNEMEDPQVANSFYKTASKKDIRQNVELAMKPVTEITKRQLRRIIREIKLADIRDSTTEWYDDASGERKMVPGAGWAEAQESQKKLAQQVSEYLAFSPPGPNAESMAIEQVAEDAGIPSKRVQAAVDEFGIDTSQWDDEIL